MYGTTGEGDNRRGERGERYGERRERDTSHSNIKYIVGIYTVEYLH